MHHTCVQCPQRAEKGVKDLELELEMDMRHLWVLDIEPRSFEREAHALNSEPSLPSLKGRQNLHLELTDWIYTTNIHFLFHRVGNGV